MMRCLSKKQFISSKFVRINIFFKQFDTLSHYHFLTKPDCHILKFPKQPSHLRQKLWQPHIQHRPRFTRHTRPKTDLIHPFTSIRRRLPPINLLLQLENQKLRRKLRRITYFRHKTSRKNNRFMWPDYPSG